MDGRLFLVPIVLVTGALAGCVGDGDAATGSMPLSTAESGVVEPVTGNADSAPNATATVVPVQVPFSVEGAAPSGVWICTGIQATGQCATHVIAADRYIVEITHTDALTAVTATITFTPVTPNIDSMMLMVILGRELNSPVLAWAEGPSGTQLAATGLSLNATDAISVMSWPSPDADVQGPIWINPLEQPFHVEGVVTELQAAAR